MFVGSPLYILYLRALGARIGRRRRDLSRNVPVCTDLLTIGDGTVIRKDSYFTCYRAHAGVIQTGAVTIGKDVFVGEPTVIDIDDLDGRRRPARPLLVAPVRPGRAARRALARLPAEPTDVDYRPSSRPAAAPCGGSIYSAVQLLTCWSSCPAAGVGGCRRRSSRPPRAAGALIRGPERAATTTPCRLVRPVLRPMLTAGLRGLTVPRLLNLACEPDGVYPSTASATGCTARSRA